MTGEWANKVFREYYDDVIYVSANPHINSKMETCDFDANKHFYKTIDVWSWGWNENVGTVHPKTVNEAVLKTKSKYPERKLIIHYEQPHSPYLKFSKAEYSESNTSGKKSSRNKIRNALALKFIDLLGKNTISRFRKTLGLNPLGAHFLVRSLTWMIKKWLDLHRPRKNTEWLVPKI